MDVCVYIYTVYIYIYTVYIYIYMYTSVCILGPGLGSQMGQAEIDCGEKCVRACVQSLCHTRTHTHKHAHTHAHITTGTHKHAA